MARIVGFVKDKANFIVLGAIYALAIILLCFKIWGIGGELLVVAIFFTFYQHTDFGGKR